MNDQYRLLINYVKFFCVQPNGMSQKTGFLYDVDPFDASDAGLDSDGDGHTNLEEYQGGSDPNSADSIPGEVITPP